MNGLAFNGVGVLPVTEADRLAANADGVYDLGLSNDKFKNGYFPDRRPLLHCKQSAYLWWWWWPA